LPKIFRAKEISKPKKLPHRQTTNTAPNKHSFALIKFLTNSLQIK